MINDLLRLFCADVNTNLNDFAAKLGVTRKSDFVRALGITIIVDHNITRSQNYYIQQMIATYWAAEDAGLDSRWMLSIAELFNGR